MPLSGSTGNNAWGGLAYGPLYPSVLAGALIPPPADPMSLAGECSDPATASGCPSILNLFEPLPADTGIPVPAPNELFPLTRSPALVTAQQRMPGPANFPQEFDRFDKDLAFFVDFPFGSRDRNINWFAAAGVQRKRCIDRAARHASRTHGYGRRHRGQRAADRDPRCERDLKTLARGASPDVQTYYPFSALTCSQMA